MTRLRLSDLTPEQRTEAVRLTLPLPPRELSPNARTHWARKARSVAAYRLCAETMARKVVRASQRSRWDRAEVRTTFYLPDRRRRDRDNLMASMKAAWDGLVDAEILSDDRGLVQYPPVLEVDRENPRVEIEVRPA